MSLPCPCSHFHAATCRRQSPCARQRQGHAAGKDKDIHSEASKPQRKNGPGACAPRPACICTHPWYVQKDMPYIRTVQSADIPDHTSTQAQAGAQAVQRIVGARLHAPAERMHNAVRGKAAGRQHDNSMTRPGHRNRQTCCSAYYEWQLAAPDAWASEGPFPVAGQGAWGSPFSIRTHTTHQPAPPLPACPTALARPSAHPSQPLSASPPSPLLVFALLDPTRPARPSIGRQTLLAAISRVTHAAASPDASEARPAPPATTPPFFFGRGTAPCVTNQPPLSVSHRPSTSPRLVTPRAILAHSRRPAALPARTCTASPSHPSADPSAA